MNINKDSWHYKLVDHFDHEVVFDLVYGHNVTLCQYFWSVVGALVKAGSVLAGVAVLLFFCSHIIIWFVRCLNVLIDSIDRDNYEL